MVIMTPERVGSGCAIHVDNELKQTKCTRFFEALNFDEVTTRTSHAYNKEGIL